MPVLTLAEVLKANSTLFVPPAELSTGNLPPQQKAREVAASHAISKRLRGKAASLLMQGDQAALGFLLCVPYFSEPQFSNFLQCNGTDVT